MEIREYERIAAVAVAIANDITDMIEGRQTASVIAAIGMILGSLELKAAQPNRAAMFMLLDTGMDQTIENSARS